MWPTRTCKTRRTTSSHSAWPRRVHHIRAQNLYLFEDRFRTLQRKANPLSKTLFSIIIPQHQQITDWLKTLPQVDPGRIAFYGLSYGGKSAMRIPPLVKNYCLSICSADFNDWVWKNASSRSPYSYLWGNEYEIFEFDLGSTFNYAEMAALIAPRPFMVEAGTSTAWSRMRPSRMSSPRCTTCITPAWVWATAARSSSSPGRTRSTARRPSTSCTST